MANEQLSLFEGSDRSFMEGASGRLNVAKLDFIEGHTATWKELFSGFDELHVITFSSGIGFIGELIELFENAEIIFGCEEVMSYSLNEVMAFQTALIDKIRSNKTKDRLIERINNQTLKLLVTRSVVSHEKIYLLSANDGRKRVIMGSANMSYQAFSGKQRENISYFDGQEAYEWYMSSYKSLKNDCTDEITEKAIMIANSEDGIDELPVSNTVKINKALAIVPENDLNDEIEFALGNL